MTAAERRFSTGLPFLDRRIGGGLVPGGLLALTAPPPSQNDLLLAELTSTRPTVVISTTRPEKEVREWADADADPGDGGVTVVTAGPDALLENPERATESLPPESFLIVDPTDGLEAGGRERYLAFLDHLKSELRACETVGILHAIDQMETPPLRSLTLHRADYVWQLELLVLSREIKNRLLVTKARRGRALTEPIPLRLTDRVQVDTSRRIG
jgi:hypothetical protein